MNRLFSLVPVVVVLFVVAVLIWAAINLLQPDEIFHGTVIDKQIIPAGWQESDLIVTVQIGDSKRFFLARNSIVYASIAVGAQCDLATYQSPPSIVVIRSAKCTERPQ